jgi:hypothetical protein
MTYQPYPTGGGSTHMEQPQQQAVQPRSVRTAVILMYVGAGLAALGLIDVLVFSGRIKAAVRRAALRARTTKPLTASQIHAIENFYILIFVVVLLVAIGLWLWMAWANGRGKGWARILSSVFFGLNTIWLVFFGGRAVSTLILIGLGWLVGLAALIFLWRRDTTQYIAQSQQGGLRP